MPSPAPEVESAVASIGSGNNHTATSQGDNTLPDPHAGQDMTNIAVAFALRPNSREERNARRLYLMSYILTRTVTLFMSLFSALAIKAHWSSIFSTVLAALNYFLSAFLLPLAARYETKVWAGDLGPFKNTGFWICALATSFLSLGYDDAPHEHWKQDQKDYKSYVSFVYATLVIIKTTLSIIVLIFSGIGLYSSATWPKYANIFITAFSSVVILDLYNSFSEEESRLAKLARAEAPKSAVPEPSVSRQLA